MQHTLQVVCVFFPHSFSEFGVVFVVDAPFALVSDLNLTSAAHAALDLMRAVQSLATSVRCNLRQYILAKTTTR